MQRLVEAATRPWCLLWDAASPFASVALARRVLAAAGKTGAATCCLPLEVPCLLLDAGRVAGDRPAASAALSQTPQAYARTLLCEVVAQANQCGWRTQSTVQLVHRAGHAVVAVPGEKLNLKLTTQDDWLLAQALAGRLQS